MLVVLLPALNCQAFTQNGQNLLRQSIEMINATWTHAWREDDPTDSNVLTAPAGPAQPATSCQHVG